jgi:hypothetical protein
VCGQNPPDQVFVDLQTERLRKVLCDPGAAKTPIAPFEFTDGLDQLRRWPFGTGLASGVGGVKKSVFEIPEPTMKAQQGGRFENDGSTQKSTCVQEPAKESEEHPVSRSQIGCSMPRPLQDQELLLQKQAFGQDSSGSAIAQQSSKPGQKVHKQDDSFSHHQEGWAALESKARTTANRSEC